jgi:putative Holliday junction resolvase
VLAFDFGEKRIGVAVGDAAVGIAHPLAGIAAEDNRTRFAGIARLIGEWRPAVLVVGLPAHPDGAEHEISRLARRFARRLEGRFELPVRLVDERYSTRAAEAGLREQRVHGARRAAALDSAAAQEILQAYFEECAVKKVTQESDEKS